VRQFLPHRTTLRAAIPIPPDLAIEVLSPGTAQTDRGRKRQLLGRFALREYWLVDPEARTVEVHALAGGILELTQCAAAAVETIRSPLLGPLEDAMASFFSSPLK
jgi:Uma2 family endonuclease